MPVATLRRTTNRILVGRAAPGPRQRAHASGAELSARSGAASARVRVLDSQRDGRPAAAARSRGGRDRRRRSRGASTKPCAAAPRSGWRHQQYARDVRAARRDSPLGGVLFFELIRFNAPDPSRWWSSRRASGSTPFRRMPAREAEPRRARAVLGGPARVPRDSRSDRSPALRAVQRPSLRGGGGNRVHPDRRRTVARVSRKSVGSWDPSWTPPGVHAGAVSG